MISNEPHTLATRAADVGMRAAADYIRGEGAEPGHVIVLLNLTVENDEQMYGGMGAHGVEDERDMLAVLLAHVSEAASQLGVSMTMVPIRQNDAESS